MPRVSKKSRPRPIVLITIEGLGIAPPSDGNAIANAKTPYFDHLVTHYPATTLAASGPAIGLLEGSAGSSEIGHSVIGLGTRWPRPRRVIDEAFALQSFKSLASFKDLAVLLKSKQRKVHLIGLLSNAENLASFDQMKKLFDWTAKHSSNILVHCILDGKESGPIAAQRLINELSQHVSGRGRIATLIGRIYGLDDKYNLGRSEKAYGLWCKRQGNEVSSVEAALQDAYEKKIFDEEFPPTAIGPEVDTIAKDDVVIFWHHSGRELNQVINLIAQRCPDTKIFTLSDRGLGENARPLFSLPENRPSLGSIFAQNGFKQLRIGDSAGFAGAAYWLDGMAPVYENVERRLAPTPPLTNLSEAVLESLAALRHLVIEGATSSSFDFIAVTISAIDVLAHHATPDEVRPIIEAVDEHIRLIAETIETLGGIAIISSSHGLAERLLDPATGTAISAHSLNPVPLYLVGKRFEGLNFGWPEPPAGHLQLVEPIGTLADIAPTILSLLNLPIPSEMEGHNLGK